MVMVVQIEEPIVSWDDPRWARAGITHRQLDYWTRQGYVHATDPAPGSGTSRRWPVDELHVAIRTRRLIDVGFLLPAALQVARRGPGRHELAEGITIEVVSA